jgi:kojibiose phosphorylase
LNDRLLGLSRRRSLEVILGGRELPPAVFDEMLERKNEVFWELVEGLDQGDLLPGAMRLLGELAAIGVRTGLASASRNAGRILERLGVRDCLDVLVDGNSGAGPAPETGLLLQAARALETPSCDCLVIVNSQAGVQAALAAGMVVVGLGRPQIVGQAHAVLPGLQEVHASDLEAIHGWWQACQPFSAGGVQEPLAGR